MTQAQVTTADLDPRIVEKIAARIIVALDKHDDVREAVKTAAWDMLQEVRALGWSQQAQTAVVASVLVVGGEIIGAAIEATLAAEIER